jgi:hypothetical protein
MRGRTVPIKHGSWKGWLLAGSGAVVLALAVRQSGTWAREDPQAVPARPHAKASSPGVPAWLDVAPPGTALQGGTQDTTLHTGTQQTLLRSNTQSTTLQSGTDSTLIRAQVERVGGPVNILILIDCSQSMKEGITGGMLDFMGLSSGAEPKMEAAKRVLEKTLARIPGDVNVGLRVFGQRFDNDPVGDCNQTALLVPLGTHNRKSITDSVRNLHPYGLTPLAYALQQAEGDLRGSAGTKTMILISDGVDTCGGDPCAYIRRLSEHGIKIKIDIVGLGLKGDREAKSELDCIARNSGGKFYDANTAAELVDSLNVSVKQAISGKVITRMAQPTSTSPPVDLKP